MVRDDAKLVGVRNKRCREVWSWYYGHWPLQLKKVIHTSRVDRGRIVTCSTWVEKVETGCPASFPYVMCLMMTWVEKVANGCSESFAYVMCLMMKYRNEIVRDGNSRDGGTAMSVAVKSNGVNKYSVDEI